MEPYFTQRFAYRLIVVFGITFFALPVSITYKWPAEWLFAPGCAVLLLVIARAIQQGTNNIARKARDMDDDY